MYLDTLKGILTPFLGTSLGAAFVFFMKKNLGDTLQRLLNGFAAGVMLYVVVAELIPEMSDEKKRKQEPSFLRRDSV